MNKLGENHKILIMAFLLVIAVILTYYFHIILGTCTVYTHFFYIPVFLAALWWKRKGLLIAVFLASLILFSHVFILIEPITLDDFFRPFILLFIGIVSSNLFEEKDKLFQAEQRYKQQKEFFSVVLDSIDAQISIVDVNNFNIVCGNKKFLTNVGKTNEEVLGQPCYKIIQQRSDPCTPPDFICPLPETVKTHKYSAAVHVYHGKNDEKKYVEISTSPIYDESGKIIEVVHIARDITERKQADEALRIANENTKTILEKAPFGVVVIGRDRKIRMVNDTALKMSGMENADIMLGKNCGEYLCPAQQNECPILDKGQQVENSERILRRKDGKEIPIIKTVTEINIDGEDVLLETFVDITERKQAGEILEETNIELRKADKLKTQFLSVVSHELRTPLTPMKAQLQMFLGGYLGDITEKQTKSLEMILRNTSRLDRLIGDVLDISKLESGSMKFIMEKNNLNTNVENAVETMRPKAEEKNITLSLKQDLIPEIVFDADRIIQLIINLVNNAIKFTDPDGTIEVEVLDNSNYATVKVKDSGIGIEKEDLERIFIPFEQVDSSYTRKYEGSGLGLAISQGIVTSHGGKLWIESEPGKGSCFQFTIDYNCAITNEAIETDLFQKESTIEYSG